MLTDPLQPVRGPDGRIIPSPIIDAYNRLVERAGCPRPSHRMELFTTSRDEEAADAVWQTAGFARYREVIGLNPGGAFGPAKNWDVKSFAAVARMFVDQRGSGVLVFCGPAERQLARDIADLAQRPGVFAPGGPTVVPGFEQGMCPPHRSADHH